MNNMLRNILIVISFSVDYICTSMTIICSFTAIMMLPQEVYQDVYYIGIHTAVVLLVNCLCLFLFYDRYDWPHKAYIIICLMIMTVAIIYEGIWWPNRGDTIHLSIIAALIADILLLILNGLIKSKTNPIALKYRVIIFVICIPLLYIADIVMILWHSKSIMGYSDWNSFFDAMEASQMD